MTAKLDLPYLFKKSHKTFADFEASKSISPSQMKALKQEEYEKVRLDTLAVLSEYLGCEVSEIFVEEHTPCDVDSRNSRGSFCG